MQYQKSILASVHPWFVCLKYILIYILFIFITDTTRKPRQGEVPGKDYCFVSREEMLKAISNGEFLEYTEFSGNIYGTRYVYGFVLIYLFIVPLFIFNKK